MRFIKRCVFYCLRCLLFFHLSFKPLFQCFSLNVHMSYSFIWGNEQTCNMMFILYFCVTILFYCCWAGLTRFIVYEKSKTSNSLYNPFWHLTTRFWLITWMTNPIRNGVLLNSSFYFLFLILLLRCDYCQITAIISQCPDVRSNLIFFLQNDNKPDTHLLMFNVQCSMHSIYSIVI